MQAYAELFQVGFASGGMMKISWPLRYKSTKPEAQLAGLVALLGEADEVLMRTYFLQLLPKSQESTVPYYSAHFYAAVVRSREEARWWQP